MTVEEFAEWLYHYYNTGTLDIPERVTGPCNRDNYRSVAEAMYRTAAQIEALYFVDSSAWELHANIRKYKCTHTAISGSKGEYEFVQAYIRSPLISKVITDRLDELHVLYENEKDVINL